MATQVQINAIADIILETFEGDAELFRDSLSEIKENTESVTITNKIARLREQIKVFTDEKNAEIQELLGQ